MSSSSPSLGDISSQLLLLPGLSMSAGGGDLLLARSGSGSPSNAGAVTTGKVPKEALLSRSWLGACSSALPWEREVLQEGWDRPHAVPSGGMGVPGVPGPGQGHGPLSEGSQRWQSLANPLCFLKRELAQTMMAPFLLSHRSSAVVRQESCNKTLAFNFMHGELLTCSPLPVLPPTVPFPTAAIFPC